MHELSVSIIVPVLNEAVAIPAQLEALLGLRDGKVEVIVVDGGSDDETAELARPRADRVLVAPRGRARQMNHGAQASEGQVLVFLHADTRLPEGAVDAIRAAIMRGAQWGRFDVRLASPRPSLQMVSGLMNWRSRLTGIATGDQTFFVRRELFERVGGFPDLALMEDIALSARLKRISRPACLTLRVVSSARRWEKNGVWRTIFLMWRLRAEFFFGRDADELARRYGYSPLEH